MDLHVPYSTSPALTPARDRASASCLISTSLCVEALLFPRHIRAAPVLSVYRGLHAREVKE